MKIAIVDDRFDYVDNLQQAVEACGHEAVLVEVGCSGGLDLNGTVAAIQEANPDFVLLDHDMGMFTGQEVADKIGLSPDKLIGTSQRKQPYCGRQMPHNLDKSYDYTLPVEEFQKLFA
jgi:CheY-like chemotaxis protein